MSENEENKVEEVKEEANKTFNEAKKQIKNINLKEEAKAGKSLLKSLWESPSDTIKKIADTEDNGIFRTALIFVAVWMFIAAVNYILNNSTFRFLSVLRLVLTPALRVMAMTVAFCVVNNRAKDSFSKVLTSISIAYIPEVIASLLWILRNFASNIGSILSPVGGLLSVVSIILMYVTIKALAQEENEEKSIKTFIKVQAVFYIIAFALSFINIYI